MPGVHVMFVFAFQIHHLGGAHTVSARVPPTLPHSFNTSNTGCGSTSWAGMHWRASRAPSLWPSHCLSVFVTDSNRSQLH